MPDLTPDRLARLRALAAEATPGQWWPASRWEPICGPRETNTTWYIPGLERWHELPTSVQFGKDEATARYVAAVSPDVVVGLLDEIERLWAIMGDSDLLECGLRGLIASLEQVAQIDRNQLGDGEPMSTDAQAARALLAAITAARGRKATDA